MIDPISRTWIWPFKFTLKTITDSWYNSQHMWKDSVRKTRHNIVSRMKVSIFKCGKWKYHHILKKKRKSVVTFRSLIMATVSSFLSLHTQIIRTINVTA